MSPGVVRRAARRSEMQDMFAVRMRLGQSLSRPASTCIEDPRVRTSSVASRSARSERIPRCAIGGWSRGPRRRSDEGCVKSLTPRAPPTSTPHCQWTPPPRHRLDTAPLDPPPRHARDTLRHFRGQGSSDATDSHVLRAGASRAPAPSCPHSRSAPRTGPIITLAYAN